MPTTRFVKEREDKQQEMQIDWNHMEKCPECGAYKGHSPRCSIMPEDYAKAELKRYYEAWLKKEMNCRKWLSKAQKEAEFWKGKFVVVKNENNILRKKLFNNKP